MKETKLYTCEYCNTSYKENIKCQECEKGHKKIKSIDSCKYVSIKGDATGYPSKIVIVMDNGEKVEYKRY